MHRDPEYYEVSHLHWVVVIKDGKTDLYSPAKELHLGYAADLRGFERISEEEFKRKLVKIKMEG